MGQFIDLTGQTFGQLTVLARNDPPYDGHRRPLWLCQCDCGKKVAIGSQFLRRGTATSCGCSRLRDLTGQVFNRLTVIRQAASRDRAVYWLCRCDCGKTVEVRARALLRGSTWSCGCSASRTIVRTIAGPKRDLTGQKFGRLKVVGPAIERPKADRNYCWRCQCRCGKIVEVRGIALTGGRTRSCGCLKRELLVKRAKRDLTGRRFGLLRVIGPAVERPKINGNYCWLCRCRCGNTIEVRGASLANGNTRSCGCLHRKPERRKRRAVAERSKP